MPSIRNIKSEKNLSGKTVLARFDFNVPISGGRIAGDFRLKKILPTLHFLSASGAKVVAISHIGESGDTLYPIFEYLKEKFEAKFAESIASAKRVIPEMKKGEILVIENLRKNSGEKECGDDFTGELASLGELYVNEAFSVSHRKHASIVGVSRLLPSFAGPLFLEEISVLGRVLSPERPFLFILGGAKFESKIPLIEKYAQIADRLFVGGALANDFLKCRGYETGISRVSGEKCKAFALTDEKIILPRDVLVTDKNRRTIAKKIEEVSSADSIEDSGPETLRSLEKPISDSRLVVWNGPLGNYENGFDGGTKKLSEMIAGSDAFSIIGGGDTTAAVGEEGIEEKFGFVSTGGGAMLQFLLNGTLPGIEAIRTSETE